MPEATETATPFGRHRGTPVRELPSDYLKWLYGKRADWYGPFQTAVVAEFERRERERLEAEPDTPEPESPPPSLSRRKAVHTATQTIALDIVEAGVRALVPTMPNQSDREALADTRAALLKVAARLGLVQDAEVPF